ncbi:stabilizer of axonemal microtubules 2 [Menidia menidia]
MRKQTGSQKATMYTEYQSSYRAPSCYTAVTSTTTQKNPYHPLKGTGDELTTIRTYYVTKKMTKSTPKVSRPPSPPKHMKPTVTRTPPKGDYTTVYQNDFQAWTDSKRQPFKLKDNFSVSKGFTVPESISKLEKKYMSLNTNSSQPKPERKAFDGISSYRSDYVAHPVQPRQRRTAPAYQPGRGLPMEPAKPKAACPTSQDHLDRATEFFDNFKSWSLKNQLQNQNAESKPPAECLSSARADRETPRPHSAKPAQPPPGSGQRGQSGVHSFHAAVSVQECCRAWDGPQRCTPVHKTELDWPMKTTFSQCKPKPAEGKPASPGLRPAAFPSSCGPTETRQSPFHCSASMYWSSPLDRGLAWFLAEVKAS